MKCPSPIRPGRSTARSVTLYKMTGDGFDHNLDEEKLKFVEMKNIPFNQTFKLTRAATGLLKDGLAPASVLMYLFECADIGKLNRRPTAGFSVPGTIMAGQPFSLSSTTGDPDGDKLRQHWRIGEQDQSGAQVTFTVAEPGKHVIEQKVDDDGCGGTTGARLTVEALLRWNDLVLCMRYLAPSWDPHKPAMSVLPDGNLQFNAPGRYESHGSFAVATPPQPMQGDKSLRIHLVSRESQRNNKLSKSGIVMISALDQGAPRVILALDAEGQVKMIRDQHAKKIAGQWPCTAPCHLRLDRQGDTFTGYISKDGDDWKKVGNVVENIADTYYPGLFSVYGGHGGPETMVIDQWRME